MENLSLIKEKERLEAELSLVRGELQREAELAKESVGLIKEKLILAKQAEELRQEVVAEKQVSADLQAKLDHQNKNIKMLTGTKQLDKILCAGRTESSHMGLGYTGRQSNNTGQTQFVSGGYAHGEEFNSKPTGQSNVEATEVLEDWENKSSLDEED
ncbi:hypothetical protein F2Q68_00022430 [Brassica cretica]|uniref:Uncharacterized protein n=2 Tax=Brassica cretica TaxID=69181 RepID=A0A8S9FTK7_BRACR|nr:hypothetical protein F2Q68_00022430 [Brassica cretica]KAF3564973.1 hypothetical protein DY000_02018589 [Brassica cretica]